MAEQLSIEISAKDLTGQAFAAVQQQLGEINAASQSTAKGMGDLAGAAEKAGSIIKGGGIAAAVGAAVVELGKYHAETKKVVGALVDQADAAGRSVERYQAITFAANAAGISQELMTSGLQRFTVRLGEAVAGKKTAIEAFDKLGVKILDNTGKLRDEDTILAETARMLLGMSSNAERAAAAKNLLGLSGSKLLPVLRELATGADEMGRKAEAAGVIIGKDVAEAADRLEKQSSNTGMAMRKFYAEIGMPIELKFLKAVESVVGGIAEAYRNAVAQQKMWEQVDAANSAGINVGMKQGDIDGARRRADSFQGRIDNARPGDASRGQLEAARDRELASITRLQGELATLQATKAAADRTLPSGRASDGTAGFVMNDGLPAKDGGASNPKVTKTGSGGANQDRIQQAINQLQLETLAANDAVAKLMAGSGVPLKELERSIALEKKIQDEIAKLGKYDPKDPRVAQIRALVTEHERAEAAYRKTAAAAKDADDIERRMGDGTAFLRVETDRLNEAQRTGRLDTETYAVAMKDAADKAEDMNFKFQGAKGGVEGLIAGMQNAAAQWERSNRSFQQGGKLFDSLMSGMDQAIAGLASGAELNFGKMAQAFFVSMAQMEARAAASSLFKLLPGGSISGLIGLIFNGGGPDINALNQQAINNIFNGAPGLAGGGVSPVNTPFWVGENGPELMSFDRPSRVMNSDQIAGMSGDGGVSINQTMYFGSDVTQATMRDWAVKTKNETIAAVIDGRLRGGPLKRAFG